MPSGEQTVAADDLKRKREGNDFVVEFVFIFLSAVRARLPGAANWDNFLSPKNLPTPRAEEKRRREWSNLISERGLKWHRNLNLCRRRKWERSFAFNIHSIHHQNTFEQAQNSLTQFQINLHPAESSLLLPLFSFSVLELSCSSCIKISMNFYRRDVESLDWRRSSTCVHNSEQAALPAYSINLFERESRKHQSLFVQR